MGYDRPKAKNIFFTFPLSEVQVEFSDRIKTERKYILFGNKKNKNIILEINEFGDLVYKSDVGGLLSESDMMQNNQKYSKEEILIAMNNLQYEIMRTKKEGEI